MAYNENLAARLREALKSVQKVEEKKAFGGLVFMVDDKMCINVSGDNLMCRFNPEDQSKLESRKGFLPMEMKGKSMPGFCFVSPEGFESDEDFDFWLKLCLDYNKIAKPSKKMKK